MKKILKQSFILLALLGVMFTSCKKDYPEPPIQVLPIGTVYTIDQILNMESGTVFNEDASVYGIVTADEQSGNLYKSAFMQDRASGKALELHMNATSGVRIGDSIRVYLKEVTFSYYNGLPQLSGFEADGHIVILANNKPIEPAEATIADVVAGNYLAGLVKLNNVMFTEQNTFAEPNTYGNRTLVDPNDFSKTVIVRTSNYANFAKDSLPQGTGNLVCIASVYNTTWQLLVRSAKELEFNGYNPGGGGGSGLPYYQDFASSFGTYTTYDVAGAQSWEIDYNTAKMTGFVGGVNNANEDWLISAPVSLEDVSSATMVMKYIARYFSNLNEDITIQVSTDYTSGDPTQATWTQVPVTLSEGSNWNDFLTATIDLSQFVGQKVVVAVRYLSNETKAGTIEIQSILIQEGGSTPPTPTPPGTLTGDGTRENPYTADDIIALGISNSDGNKYWVKDYIAGYVDANYNYQFSADGAVATNLTIAKADFTSSADCVPVQLPVGAVRNGLNLADNPRNLGQEVLLYGTLESYFKVPGVKNVTYAEIGENSFGTDPGYVPPTPTGEVQELPYTQSFATDFGTYITKDVAGAQVWEIAYESAKMSGYSGSALDNEDWLISSPVNITGVENAMVVLNYAAKYNAPMEDDITVQVSADYQFGAEPSTATWEALPVTFANNNKDWAFDDLEASLNNFIGQTVTVAVKYISNTSGARTIEIKTITIEGDGETPPTPPTPPTPGTGQGTGTADDPFNVEAGISLQDQTPVAWVQGYIVGAVKDGVFTVTSNDQINWSAPFEKTNNVVIADDPTCNEIANCIIVNLPLSKPLCTEVNLVDHPDNMGKILKVYGTLRTYFGRAGLRDSAGSENDFVLQNPR